jgi:formylglycine-generating enzyme required for sulfatase activity
LTSPSASIERTTCPFIGLRPFEEGDAPRFFGRNQQIATLLRRLGGARFLAVAGTSGCGKSSLVRAGLIPALKRGYLASAGTRWKIAVMRPGGDPFGALARAAHVAEETLRQSSLGLVKSLRGELNARESMLLVVDQFEELFRFRREATGAGEQADAFVKLLLASAEQDEIPIYLVLTMRSDYLGDCAVFRGLPEALNDAQYLVPVLTRNQLREVVEAPVHSAGAQIAPELVQRVLNDIGHGLEQELDQLPVLQHALMRTWGEAVGSPDLGLEHYGKSGGMPGALNQHADGLYQALNDADRAVAKRVFQRLAEKEFKGRDIRRPTSFGELRIMTGASREQLGRIIGQFEDFLTSRPEPPFTDATMIDVTHEALIRQWKVLRDWAEEEARSAQVYLRLDYDASRGGRLWEDPDLAEALLLQKKSAWNATWAQRYTPQEQAYGRVEEFLSKSRRHRTWKRVQRATLVLALLAIPAAVYLWQVQKTKQEAELHRKDAEIERVLARSGAKSAEADRLLAQAARSHGEEKARLERDAEKARAEGEKLAASAKDYQTLSQKREADLAELRKSHDDLERKLRKANEENEKKLADAESDKTDLTRKLESSERERKALEAKLAASTAPPGSAVKTDTDRKPKSDKPIPLRTKENPKDGLLYVWVPPGKFSMGCTPGDNECGENEKPAREVTITRGFWMGQTEVTQAAYQKVIGTNPSRFKGEKLPVERVSWTEAARYCAAIGGRLPTEAEWEYAARGGKEAARYGELEAIAWHDRNSDSETHEVGQKQPNAFGLYDMLGNVFEWTADWDGPYLGAGTVDPKGPGSGTDRVLRGGSWVSNPRNARASFRDRLAPVFGDFIIGLRCAGEIP